MYPFITIIIVIMINTAVGAAWQMRRDDEEQSGCKNGHSPICHKPLTETFKK